jgi:hypothetical protein
MKATLMNARPLDARLARVDADHLRTKRQLAPWVERGTAYALAPPKAAAGVSKTVAARWSLGGRLVGAEADPAVGPSQNGLFPTAAAAGATRVSSRSGVPSGRRCGRPRDEERAVRPWLDRRLVVGLLRRSAVEASSGRRSGR